MRRPRPAGPWSLMARCGRAAPARPAVGRRRPAGSHRGIWPVREARGAGSGTPARREAAPLCASPASPPPGRTLPSPGGRARLDSKRVTAL